MTRAIVGSWVLVLVFSALVVSTGLWGPAGSGTAVRQSPPPAPAIGSCTVGPRALEIVRCDGDHTGEIVLTWTGDGPTGTLDPTRFPVPADAQDDPQLLCRQAAEDYVGLGGPLEFSPDIAWYPSVGRWETAIGHGPVSRFVPGWSWSACLVRSYGGDGRLLTLSESVRDAGAGAPATVPDSWRLCLRASGYWFETLPCTVPHRAELIASAEIALPSESDRRSLVQQQQAHNAAAPIFGQLQPVSPTGPPLFQLDLPAAEQECRDLAETYLGVSPDERDDLIAVLTYESLYYGDRVTVDPLVDPPVGVYGSCSVEAVGERALAGSIAGIGHSPLPYA